MPQPPPTIQGQGAQPPTANAASPQPQQGQAGQPLPQAGQGSGTAQLAQQTNQPPQQSQQAVGPHPQAQGQGPWTMQDLTKAILKSNPNISDRALGMALFKASPLLNEQGLAAYRQLGMQLQNERLLQGQERIDTGNRREDRIATGNQQKQQQSAALNQQKLAIQEAGRVLAADIQAAGFPPDEAKIKAAQDKYQKAIDAANGKFKGAINQQDSGGGKSEQPIVYDDKGKAMRLKAPGLDPKDPKNYAPVE